MSEEIWKDIKGFEGRYQVSNMGRVRSLLRHGLIRKQKKYMSSGYLCVVLYKNGKYMRFTVHRLVAIHFVDGYKKGYIVNHKDEDKHNNRSDNLEWCTYQYNNTYGKSFKDKYNKRKKRVFQRNFSGDIVCIYESVRDAAIRFSTSATSISDWCRKKHTPKNNYIWSYEDF